MDVGGGAYCNDLTINNYAAETCDIPEIDEDDTFN